MATAGDLFNICHAFLSAGNISAYTIAQRRFISEPAYALRLLYFHFAMLPPSETLAEVADGGSMTSKPCGDDHVF